jgi:hypothetical protein
MQLLLKEFYTCYICWPILLLSLSQLLCFLFDNLRHCVHSFSHPSLKCVLTSRGLPLYNPPRISMSRPFLSSCFDNLSIICMQGPTGLTTKSVVLIPSVIPSWVKGDENRIMIRASVSHHLYNSFTKEITQLLVCHSSV